MVKEERAQALIEGLYGYLEFALRNDRPAEQQLADIAHDIKEYLANGDELWYSPRTAQFRGYGE